VKHPEKKPRSLNAQARNSLVSYPVALNDIVTGHRDPASELGSASSVHEQLPVPNDEEIDEHVKTLYTLIGFLGQGAYGRALLVVPSPNSRGIVSEASEGSSVLVVLKVPRNTDGAARLLQAEARQLVSLHHPRIVRIRKVVHGCVAHVKYLEMEFAAGGSLAKKLKRLARFGRQHGSCRYCTRNLRHLTGTSAYPPPGHHTPRH